ncbi:hypothetical protein F0562_029867 [Nyssa sinensis]|uniref:Pentacotripeptide-repeat region of PRORP domain-containing protein n=1 Tax=Nyssa sinensis TaxID=561372 RepID=A0A5J5AZJ2_9ASTE|nr:hypothetical protein F0562_029867 [Nyssa sinensis]
MTSFHHLMLRLCRIPEPKRITISHFLNHRLATNGISLDTQLNVHSPKNPALPDSIQNQAKTIATQLSNCSNLSELNKLHAHIIRTHMLELYPVPFQWNNIIRSYTRLDAPCKAICIYIAMTRACVMPDAYTLPIVLKAVSQVFDTQMGRQIHSVAIKHCLESNEFCESGFISLYSKAGEFENARKVFEQNCDRKLGSWNAVIGGLSQGGCAKEAIEMFMELKKSGFEPDDVTMHYGCMVDLLGRAGLLEEAREMVEGMPMKANVIIWGCLMGACEKYANAKMGEWVAKHLLELEPWNDGVYVVLSNIYASDGLWEEVERVRGIMKERRLAKIPAYSLATSST